MRKMLPILACLASPVAAWEFSPQPICTLRHDTPDVAVRVTYDARVPVYEITLTLAQGTWPDSASFAIAFTGGRALTIGTDRHKVSADRRTLSVKDSGFGNVLNGIEFNSQAQARAGDAAVTIPLAGAAAPMQQFRACPAPGLS